MTYESFIQYLKHPRTLSAEAQPLLKELMAQYPYFGIARWLYLKSLYNSKSIYFEQELKKTALYASNRSNLYFFIHPEEEIEQEFTLRERTTSAGSYFDMMNLLDNKGENNRGALQSLAERLKKAREMLVVGADSPSRIQKRPANPVQHVHAPDSDKAEEAEFDQQAQLAKQLIKNKEYDEAILILEKLNLINPKKSVYFADQIRFLKKITQK